MDFTRIELQEEVDGFVLVTASRVNPDPDSPKRRAWDARVHLSTGKVVYKSVGRVPSDEVLVNLARSAELICDDSGW